MVQIRTTERAILAGVLGLAMAGVALTSASAAPSVEPFAVSIEIPTEGDITLPPCAGTTSTPGGIVNTPGEIVLTGAAAADLRAGRTVFLHDNKGQVIAQPDGSYNSASSRLPYCGAHLVGSTVTIDWRFCTDEPLGGCAGRPPGPVAGNGKLTATQEAAIAQLLLDPDLATKRTRALVQLQVWCVSESGSDPSAQPGSVYTTGRDYFNAHQFTGAPGNPESAPITDEEATCAAVPELPDVAELSVAGPAAELVAGDTAVFTLETNVPGTFSLALTGGTDLALCFPVAGASLSGTTLTVDTPGTVAICAARSSAGQIELDVSGEAVDPAHLTFAHNGDADCQVFVDYATGDRIELRASATADYRDRPSVSVGDYVWVDEDRDGRQDEGEPGIGGVTLVLTGPDGEPVTDVHGNVVVPVVTDDAGFYEFIDLPVLDDGQSYTVTIDREASEAALAPYVPTVADQGDREGDSSTWEASSEGLTQDGDRDPTLDFGFVLAPVPSPSGSESPSPSGSPSASPSGSVSTSPVAGPSSGSSATSAPATSTGAAGPLPSTGAGSALAVGASAALVLSAGGLLVLLTRRARLR